MQLKAKNAEFLVLEKNFSSIQDKLNKAHEEKSYIINEEKAKREELTRKYENFLRDLQSKYQNFENDDLVKENAALRKKFEEYVQNTTNIKETIEQQMKLKEQQTLNFENEFKTQIKGKMEELV